MQKISVVLIALVMTGCASQGVPKGSVAFCGSFEFTGTLTKTASEGRALGLSDAAMAQRMTVDDVIKLAEAMGCSQ